MTFLEIKISLLLRSNRTVPLTQCLYPRNMNFLALDASFVLLKTFKSCMLGVFLCNKKYDDLFVRRVLGTLFIMYVAWRIASDQNYFGNFDWKRSVLFTLRIC